MSSELAVVTNHLAWTPEQVDLLKRTICKGSNDDEFQLFLHVAKRSGLDPFARQIHAVKRWNAKANREEMAIQVGVDGFRLVADRTGKYAGSDDPVFDDEQSPSKATVTVYKMVSGTRCAFTASARWSEYYPGDKQGFMWKKMPCLMLGKTAECLALRKAFPAELSGMYGEEELDQSGPVIEEPLHAHPAPAPAKPAEPAKVIAPVRTKLSVGNEIHAIAKQINISDADLAAWACDFSKKPTTQAMTLNDLEAFLKELQKEL